MEELKSLGKHNKPKPWDVDPDMERCLERWAVEKKFDPTWNPTGMLEVSSFSRVYPQRREKHLLKCWPRVKSALKEHGVSCELNLVERYMTVSTTKKTRDPYIIVKARDLLRLLSRSVPARQALKILEDDMSYDIINIGRLAPSKEKFLITRVLFLGHKSSSLKTLETSTNCFIRLQGNTVAAMGSFRALRRLRIIVEHCFLNGMRPSDVLKTMEDAGKCGPNRFTKEKDPFTDSPWYLPSANTFWEDGGYMLPLYDRF
ncbi:KRR1 small subunit processome component homolog [Brassica rapa]|uniref:KRR1 small subunit processome component homolog n=1 Tax=Brassica campestris TaxID=3711 RepID=UPI0006AAD9C4|nr:KRR1 small subunit processome component homolog [Brassica rapa]